MDVSVSVSFFQDELASTIEHAVKAAVDTVLCQITKVVGGKFTEFRMEMAGKEKENESLKLRLEISESELKAVRECMNAADADIKQPLRNMNPDCNEQDFQRIENQGLFTRVQDSAERRAFSEAEEGPVMEALYMKEEICDQEWCGRIMEITDLTSAEDTCSSVGEEDSVLGSIQRKHHPPQERAADGKEEGAMPSTSSTASDLGRRTSTPAPQNKISTDGKLQRKQKHRESTPQDEWAPLQLKLRIQECTIAKKRRSNTTRQWRHKIKQNPELYEEHKRKEAARARLYRLNQSPGKKELEKEKAKERARKCRERQKKIKTLSFPEVSSA
ncbi:uncharacterized protein LOC131724857 isoform X5 [Acipenser ruthenus]|uniref:uncharacterized protein LOC131724857 isoform X5 n=1 Tax=Acipenser ruthenus TaxID=7906 RepID=UPI002742344B|nr:uncharacterized protein LOC131724857 isoform X5 [Acipenser ruthenus]